MLVSNTLKQDVSNCKRVKKSNTKVVYFSCGSNNLAALISTQAVISFVWYYKSKNYQKQMYHI